MTPMTYARIKQVAAELKISVNDLLALSAKNDPFYVGTPTDIMQAEWFTAIWKRTGYTQAHLRRIHYWTVSQTPPVKMHNGDPYENTEACWKYLTQASKMARYLGLVQIAAIVDNKNPTPHEFAEFSQTDVIEYELDLPDLDEPQVKLFGPGDSNAQPYLLEVWAEKSTMNDVLLPVCEQYGANLATFEGEVSITACYSLILRMKAAGFKPTRLFYISDFDPAGNSMPVATARKIEFMLSHYGVTADVRLKPLALNADQIDQYNLPRIPIKETERRAAKFEENFGGGACELDALQALHPGVLGRMVGNALSEYYSQEAADYANAQARAVRDEIVAQRDEIMSRYEDELEAVQGMLDELRSIRVEAEEYPVQVQEPHVDEEDDDWMFSSQRGYVQQIQKYKQHKGIETFSD